MKPVSIAVIADLHYGSPSPIASRRSDLADLLLWRAVTRLNRWVKPDVTVVLGDLLDNGGEVEAEKHYLHLRGILDKLQSPCIVLPGNHDGDADAFYRVFRRPADIEEHAGVRFLTFLDREEPGYNACRSAADLTRFAAARQDWHGPIVALQHVCLASPAAAVVPYNYTNAAEVIAAMQAADVRLSLSGHYHRGAPMTRLDGVTFVNAPGLCEAPFPFTVVTLDGDRVTSARHELAMPKELRLIDGHLHTQLAYCSDNMTVERAIAMADACGLAGLAFTEHSGHLYFPASRYWNQGCFADGMAGADPADRRMDAYFDLKRQFESSTVRFGLEVDIDYRGELLLAEADRPHFDYLVGAVHYLPNLSREAPPTPRDHDEFLFLSEKLMTSGMAVLAHPFRVYRRSGWPAPEELFLPLARLLRKYGVAAEINYHTNEPPAEFFRVCLAEGVRISFASDAHHLGEVGDFAPHLALLKEAGFDGELADILVSPTAV